MDHVGPGRPTAGGRGAAPRRGRVAALRRGGGRGHGELTGPSGRVPPAGSLVMAAATASARGRAPGSPSAAPPRRIVRPLAVHRPSPPSQSEMSVPDADRARRSPCRDDTPVSSLRDIVPLRSVTIIGICDRMRHGRVRGTAEGARTGVRDRRRRHVPSGRREDHVAQRLAVHEAAQLVAPAAARRGAGTRRWVRRRAG